MIRWILIPAAILCAVVSVFAQGVSLPSPGPGNTASSLPVFLGGTATTGTLSTVAITTTTAVPAGAGIFIGCGGNKGSSFTVTSATDGTNTYVKAAGGYSATNDYDTELWYTANIASQLNSGATLTCNFTATSNAGPAIIAAYQNGIPSTPIDQTAVGNSNSTASPSAGPTGTLAQANELAIGMLGGNFAVGGLGTITESSGFTSLGTVSVSSQGGMHLGYKLTSATTALTYNPTLGGAVAVGTLIATFK